VPCRHFARDLEELEQRYLKKARETLAALAASGGAAAELGVDEKRKLIADAELEVRKEIKLFSLGGCWGWRP
jgi:hypothetical protein